MAKLQQIIKPEADWLPYLQMRGPASLVSQLVHPQMISNSLQSDPGCVETLVRLCGVRTDVADRLDLARVIAVPGRDTAVERLIPMLAVTAFCVRELTSREDSAQEDLLPEGLEAAVPCLVLQPERAPALIERLSRDTVDAAAHSRHPVSHPEMFQEFIARFGRVHLPGNPTRYQLAEWHEDQLMMGIHTGLALRDIAISKAPSLQRSQAFDVVRAAGRRSQLVHVTRLLDPLIEQVGRQVRKPVALDVMLKASKMSLPDLLSVRPGRASVQPFPMP